MSSALPHLPPAASPSVPPPAPRGVGYIDLDTAARRWGIDRSSFIKRHLPRFIARGHARLTAAPAGAGSVYQVREDADARLARIRFADDLPADLKSLTDTQRRRVLLKTAILDEWDRFTACDAMKAVPREQADRHFIKLLAASALPVKLPRGMKPPSDRTLRNWRAAFRREGLAGLIDERGTRQQKPSGDDPFLKCVRRFYLDQRQRSVKLCWELACRQAAEQGWMTRSYPQTKRDVAKLPKAVVILHPRGEKAYNDLAGRFVQRDYSALASNEIWCADHHQFDVWVKCDGKHVRPWLTAFQDVRSRKIVGWCITASGGNTDTILEAFAKGIEAHGVPVSVYADNGKDFDSAALQGVTKRQRRAGLSPAGVGTRGVFGMLGVSVMHCWPYHGQSKPIERFFGTAEDRFGKLQPTYCGNSPANRPENLASKLDRDAAPKLADFIEQFALWLEGDYHAQPHSGDGMDGGTPARVFDAHLETKRTVDPAIRAVLLWKPAGAKIGRLGVRCGGLYYGRDDLALTRRLGEEVIVRVDPADANRVAVCEPSGPLICIATCNQRLPFKPTQQEVREHAAAVQRDRKAVKEYHQARPRLHQDTAARMYQERAEKARKEREANPPAAPTLKPISTPLDGQVTALQQAMNPRAEETAPPLRFLYPLPPDDAAAEPGMSFRELMAHREAAQQAGADGSNGVDSFAQLGALMPRKAASGE